MDEIAEVAGKFGIKFKKAIKPDAAAIALVHILDDNYILRGRQLSKHTEKRFAREVALIDKIRPLFKFQMPKPLQSLAGKQFVAHENIFWTLYPKLPGTIMGTWQKIHEVREKEIINLLLELSHLHTRTQNATTIDREYFIKDIESRFKDIQTQLPAGVRSRIIEALAAVKEHTKLAPTTDFCFVHGDFHPGNILTDNKGNVVGLLDLDWCRIGNPLEDLAYTTMMLMRDYTISPGFNEKYMEKLLAGYGLEPRFLNIFKEYLLLYSLFDVHIFKHAINLPNKEFYYDYQIKFLESLCQVYQ